MEVITKKKGKEFWVTQINNGFFHFVTDFYFLISEKSVNTEYYNKLKMVT